MSAYQVENPQTKEMTKTNILYLGYNVAMNEYDADRLNNDVLKCYQYVEFLEPLNTDEMKQWIAENKPEQIERWRSENEVEEYFQKTPKKE